MASEKCSSNEQLVTGAGKARRGKAGSLTASIRRRLRWPGLIEWKRKICQGSVACRHNGGVSVSWELGSSRPADTSRAALSPVPRHKSMLQEGFEITEKPISTSVLGHRLPLPSYTGVKTSISAPPPPRILSDQTSPVQ